MGITSDGVREIFKGLENGDGAAFFEHVADNVTGLSKGPTHSLVTTVARRHLERAPSPS